MVTDPDGAATVGGGVSLQNDQTKTAGRSGGFATRAVRRVGGDEESFPSRIPGHRPGNPAGNNVDPLRRGGRADQSGAPVETNRPVIGIKGKGGVVADPDLAAIRESNLRNCLGLRLNLAPGRDFIPHRDNFGIPSVHPLHSGKQRSDGPFP